MQRGTFRQAIEEVDVEGLQADFPQMNELELAALRSYTASGYYDLNWSLRNGNADKYNRLLEYYTNKGLDKLPIHTEEEVYRGTTIKRSQLQKYSRAFKAGTSIIEKAFVSTSSLVKTARSFGDNPGTNQVRVFFTILQKDGRSVKYLSAHSSENEILIKSKSKFKVIDYERETIGKYTVYNIMLEQIE